MKFYSGHIYHVYNQGNNRDKIFFETENYLFFLKKIEYHICPYADILAWCLMPNHFHLLIKVKDDYPSPPKLDNSEKRVDLLNKDIGSLQGSYTQAINKKYKWSGSLFRSRAKAKSSENIRTRDNYALNCFFYIHQNPIRAGLVKRMEDWEYSSFRDYAGLRNGKLCNKELTLDLLNLPRKSDEFHKISQQTIPEHFLESLF